MASKHKSEFTVNATFRDLVTGALGAGLAIIPVAQNAGPIFEASRNMLMGAFAASAMPQNLSHAVATGVAFAVPPLLALAASVKTYDLISAGSAALRGNIVPVETDKKEASSPTHRSPSAAMQ